MIQSKDTLFLVIPSFISIEMPNIYLCLTFGNNNNKYARRVLKCVESGCGTPYTATHTLYLVPYNEIHAAHRGVLDGSFAG